MYIHGLIPGNFMELAEVVPIAVVMCTALVQTVHTKTFCSISSGSSINFLSVKLISGLSQLY